MKLTHPRKTKPTIRCNVRASEIGTFVALPKSANAKLPPRGAVAIEGSFNGIPFQAILEPDGAGSRRLKISQGMRNSLRKDNAGEVTIEITKVGEEFETRVPSDLAKAIAAMPRAAATWADITPLARRDWIFWFISAKKRETRERHLEKARDMLGSGKRRICCFGGANWLMKSNGTLNKSKK